MILIGFCCISRETRISDRSLAYHFAVQQCLARKMFPMLFRRLSESEQFNENANEKNFSL